MKALSVIAGVLVLIGALNWGLVGLVKLDLVAAVFGQSVLATVVYTLVGLAGVFLAVQWGTAPRRLAAVPA